MAAGSSAGGAVAAAGISVGGIFSAVGGAITAILSGATAPVLIAVSAVSVVTLTTIISTGAAFVTATQPTDEWSNNEGVLFSVSKAVDKSKVDNEIPTYVTFQVTITAKADITISKVDDSLVAFSQSTAGNNTGMKTLTPPEIKGSKPTSLTKGKPVTIDFEPYLVTGHPDSRLVNTITITATGIVNGQQKTETLTANAQVQVGTPPVSACSVAPEGSACSVTNLAQALKDLGLTTTTDRLENASKICKAENGVRVNDGCTDGTNRHNEYSVGIFQINLFANDYFCRRILDGQSPWNESHYCGRNCGDACVRDEDLLQKCADYWTQPEHNIQAAWEKSSQFQTWSAWSTAKPPSLKCPRCCNIP